jgi:hypothetical protein
MPTPVAAAGVALSVAGIVAAVMFGSSLQRLADTPARYGYTGDLTIADAREDDMTTHHGHRVRRDHGRLPADADGLRELWHHLAQGAAFCSTCGTKQS